MFSRMKDLNQMDLLSVSHKRLTILRIWLYSLVLGIILEILHRQSLTEVFTFAISKPMVFAYNVLIIFATLSASLFFKRKYFMFGMASFGWFVLGVCNFIIQIFRRTPLTSDDFLLINSLFNIIGIYLNPFQISLIVLAIGISLLIIVRSWMKSVKLNVVFRQGIVTMSVSLLLLNVMPNVSPAIYAFQNTNGNLVEIFDEFGFVYSFVSSVLDKGIQEPDVYTKKSIESIVKTLTKDSHNAIKANIIFVQLESFFDVTRLSGVSYSANPIPNFTALKQKYSSGLLLVPTLGGGTANTEFEVITGMSLDYFGTGEYPYKSVLLEQTAESMAYNLKKLGYRASIMHNNSGNFYGRHLVFANLGFDAFSTLETMRNVEFNELGWAKDKVLIDEIMEAIQYSDEPDFVYTIAVQSHGDYPRIENLAYPFQVFGVMNKSDENQLEYYLEQINEADAIIPEIIQKVEQSGEPTVIVFFGDHLPGLNFESFISGNRNTTDYVVWDNIGLEKQNKNVQTYQLGAHVLNQLNIHEGLFTQIHQSEVNNPNYETILHLLQFDILYGEKYAYSQMNSYMPSKLQIGFRMQELTQARIFHEKMIVTGHNFTRYSQIMVNGALVETQYISQSMLIASSDVVRPGSTIGVAIVSANNEIIGKTNTMRVK
ncbi:MAG: LTA synthase family protein [Erysipelotrichaceae bacterium]|nr:LTA synthase family protein [Erysipelotrichaceae bacterium]MDP3305878.1 LTA synthase family protein [Erysipelotrichaceae bacterium]